MEASLRRLALAGSVVFTGLATAGAGAAPGGAAAIRATAARTPRAGSTPPMAIPGPSRASPGPVAPATDAIRAAGMAGSAPGRRLPPRPGGEASPPGARRLIRVDEFRPPRWFGPGLRRRPDDLIRIGLAAEDPDADPAGDRPG